MGNSSLTTPTSIEDQPFPLRSYESSDGHLRICASTTNPAATRNAHNQVSMRPPVQTRGISKAKRRRSKIERQQAVVLIHQNRCINTLAI